VCVCVCVRAHACFSGPVLKQGVSDVFGQGLPDDVTLVMVRLTRVCHKGCMFST
jgi:hypothetical protein